MLNKLIKSDQYEGVYYDPKENGWWPIYPPLDNTFYYTEDNCYYVPDSYFEDYDLMGYDEEAVRSTLNRKLKITNKVDDLKIILTPTEWDVLNKDLARSKKPLDQMSQQKS